MRLDDDKLKQAGFLAVLIAMGIVCLWFLYFFVNALLGAVIFYILLRRANFFLTNRFRFRGGRSLAAVIMMLVSFVVLVLPVLGLSLMLSNKVSYIIQHYEDILRVLVASSHEIQEYFGIDLRSAGIISKISSIAADVLPRLVTATAGAVADVFVLYFVLYFLLVNAEKFEKLVRNNLPFRNNNDQLLLTELKSQTLSNAIGIPILAILQAVVAGISYWALGMNEPLFWATVTGLMSMMPLVGTTVVWLPISIYMFAQGNHWQGIALFLYGLIVITNIDNVFRFILQRKLGDVHPLVTFFGVILGLQLFGFVGIIFGPLLISYFILLLKIYHKEYLKP